jgi:hypothetical protein
MTTGRISAVRRCELRSLLPIAITLLVSPSAAAAKPAKATADTPLLSCGVSSPVSIDVQVCAGAATGAPAGFSLQWMTADEYAATGWQDSELLCSGSFSGNANESRYDLAPGECVTVKVGDFLFDNGASSNCTEPLLCETTYVFRAFAHANSSLKRSDFTADLSCSTLPCEGGEGCTLTQGYWKTHGPEGCATGGNVNAWPATSLDLGAISYTDLELCSIFSTPAAGNGLISLAHQLIAAKLNAGIGADFSFIAPTVAAADALIGTLVVPPVGAGSLPPSTTSSLTATLDAWNSGLIGSGHCLE